MLLGDNGIDWERQRQRKFRQQAVFTTLSGPLPDGAYQIPRNDLPGSCSKFLRKRLARDCITASSRPICR
jgi:hypothetical protein